MTVPDAQPQTRETLELAREVLEWLDQNEQGAFNICCQRCNAPFEHSGQPVAAPAEWYGGLMWERQLAEALSVLTARLDAAEEEALRFGGSVWRARAVAAEREREDLRRMLDEKLSMTATDDYLAHRFEQTWDALKAAERERDEAQALLHDTENLLSGMATASAGWRSDFKAAEKERDEAKKRADIWKEECQLDRAHAEEWQERAEAAEARLGAAERLLRERLDGTGDRYGWRDRARAVLAGGDGAIEGPTTYAEAVSDSTPRNQAWDEWFDRHPGHLVNGKCISHPIGCNRRCLVDAPGPWAGGDGQADG